MSLLVENLLTGEDNLVASYQRSRYDFASSFDITPKQVIKTLSKLHFPLKILGFILAVSS